VNSKFATHTCYRCRTEHISNWKSVGTRTVKIFELEKLYHEYSTKCTHCGAEYISTEPVEPPAKNTRKKKV